MSILINGMEMPKAGYIDVRIFPDGIASKAIGEKPYYKEFHVVEVKAPHGRLGDLDALAMKWIFGVPETREIQESPTIIEAEG